MQLMRVQISLLNSIWYDMIVYMVAPTNSSFPHETWKFVELSKIWHVIFQNEFISTNKVTKNAVFEQPLQFDEIGLWQTAVS